MQTKAELLRNEWNELVRMIMAKQSQQATHQKQMQDLDAKINLQIAKFDMALAMAKSEDKP